MKTLLAFALRDARERRSYLTSWVVEAGSLLLTVLTLYFLGQLIDRGTTGTLPEIGPSYFGFAISGTAMAVLLFQVVRGHATALRQAQLAGTVEPLLATRASAWQIAVGGSLSSIAGGFLRAIAYLAMALAFEVLHPSLELLWIAPVLLLSALSFLPFGLLAASYTLVFKRGDPVSHLLNAATLLLAGIYFPVSVLPPWLQPASHLYPVSHAVVALRSVVLESAAPIVPLVHLGAFALFATPLTAWLFRCSVDHARKTGTLAHL